MTFARPCALGCEQPITSGQALLSLLELGQRGELINRPVHFDCFARALAERVAEHLDDIGEERGPNVADVAAAVVERFTRKPR